MQFDMGESPRNTGVAMDAAESGEKINLRVIIA